MDHRGVGVTRVRFAVRDHKEGIADSESPDAATEVGHTTNSFSVTTFAPPLLGTHAAVAR